MAGAGAGGIRMRPPGMSKVRLMPRMTPVWRKKPIMRKSSSFKAPRTPKI